MKDLYWLYRSFIVREEQNELYRLCCQDEKVPLKMAIELLRKMKIAKIVPSTNFEIALQKIQMQKRFYCFRLVYAGYGWAGKHSLRDGDCGRLKRKSGRSIEVGNP